MKFIMDVISWTRLQEWPYPQMKLVTKEEIIAFRRKIGYKGVHQRSLVLDASRKKQNANTVGRLMAGIVCGQLLGWALAYIIFGYIIYYIFSRVL